MCSYQSYTSRGNLQRSNLCKVEDIKFMLLKQGFPHLCSFTICPSFNLNRLLVNTINMKLPKGLSGGQNKGEDSEKMFLEM